MLYGWPYQLPPLPHANDHRLRIYTNTSFYSRPVILHSFFSIKGLAGPVHRHISSWAAADTERSKRPTTPTRSGITFSSLTSRLRDAELASLMAISGSSSSSPSLSTPSIASLPSSFSPSTVGHPPSTPAFPSMCPNGSSPSALFYLLSTSAMKQSWPLASSSEAMSPSHISIPWLSDGNLFVLALARVGGGSWSSLN